MRIDGFIWLPDVVEKLAAKHQVAVEEAEQAFRRYPRFRFVAKGRRNKNENLYAAYGLTEAGRYLIVFFIHKSGALALIVSARDMDGKERRWYERS